jgi:CBS domain-containing protein
MASDPHDGDEHGEPGPPPVDLSIEVHRLDPEAAADITQEIRGIAEARADDGWAVEDDARPTAAAGPPTDEPLGVDELRDAWAVLDAAERTDGLRLLPREDGEEFFIALPGPDQADLLIAMRRGERRSWLRLLEPDDVADVVQAVPDDERAGLLAMLDGPTRKEVEALLAYEEDDAGGLMNTRYARLRPTMTADEAISYLRRQARTQLETIYYAYVLDGEQHLLGVVSFRDLFAAPGTQRVAEIMEKDVVSADPSLDQEALSRLFAEHDLTVMPIVDAAGVMRGIVTVDDIVDVVQEEATEDAQKFGGMEALEVPYLQSRRREMLRKRGVWLAVLLVGEMLTDLGAGVLRAPDRSRDGADAVHPADHLERRQRRLPGLDAGDPRDGAGRGPRRRLVARHAPRARDRPGAGRRPRRARLGPRAGVGRVRQLRRSLRA